ncbi:Hemolysin, contains CBS domains [Desulfonauticus submarinus]|uniref:Hemolysin, contains CBS domains n=1 Tax=Desulfonauticus submarinus TaxID=206665 RepID=A0A1H0ACT2_9BACT|nr:hemolysin family protein [Desulfonauticus submarinus]SDN30536.1 Hemolysin, contains CBS domains [Desulfonauticus submarinus]
MTKLGLAFFLAVVISALCSIAEAALYSVSWGSIERLKEKSPKLGKLLENLRSNIEQPITAILTLNTIANTAGAAIAGAAASEVFGEQSVFFFSLIFTITILIFSEIIPKTIGVVYNDKIVPLITYPLYGIIIVLKPLIRLFQALVFFIEKRKGKYTATEEDVLAVLSLGRRSGIIKPYEEESIQNILMLDKKTVKDIMTPRTVMFCLPAHITVKEALEKKKILPHSRIPVYENDIEDIVGIVLRRDLLSTLAEDKHNLTLVEIMKPVQFVPESLTLDRLLVRLLETRMHLFIVLDEYGGVAGLVTLEDVLEEILGKEIIDETDEVVDMRQLARERRKKIISKEIK